MKPQLTYDQLANADSDRAARAIMEILNSLAQYTPAEKLIAAQAAADAMTEAAHKMTGITVQDLRIITSNMQKNPKIRISQQTIERTMLK